MQYRPEIDGLRAVAVLLVFIFHLFPQFMPGGFIGVDVFFVISGFLITNIILKEIKNDQFSFLRFYTRRIKRIFPALFVMLFVSSLVALLSLGSSDSVDFFRALRFAAAQVSNFLFSQETNYFQAGHEHSPFLHTWSLGVEEQFYLLWPLGLVFLMKIKKERLQIVFLLLACLASLILSEYLASYFPKEAFYMVYSRIWELGAGGLIAFRLLKKWKPSLHLSNFLTITSLLVLIVNSFLLTASSSFPGLNGLPSVIASVIIIYITSVHKSNLVKSLLSQPTVVFIGKISYSLYLWHWPLIAFTRKFTQSHISLTQALIIVPLSFLLSYMSWRFIENPFRKKRDKNSWSETRIIFSGAFLILVTIVSANVLKGFHQSPWRYTEKISHQDFQMHKLHAPCTPSETHLSPNQVKDLSTPCAVGPTPEQPDIVILGDSHASHFFPAFTHRAKKQDLTVRLIAASACPAIFGEYNLYKNNDLIPRCREFAHQAQEYILKTPSVQTVVLAMRTDIYSNNMGTNNGEQGQFFLSTKTSPKLSIKTSQELLKILLTNTIETLHRHSKNVILMGQVPPLRKEPLKCLESASVLASYLFPTNKNKCFVFDRSYVQKQLSFEKEIFSQLSNSLPITFFESSQFIATAKKSSEILYFDDDHINKEGALFLSQFFDFPLLPLKQ